MMVNDAFAPRELGSDRVRKGEGKRRNEKYAQERTVWGCLAFDSLWLLPVCEGRIFRVKFLCAGGRRISALLWPTSLPRAGGSWTATSGLSLAPVGLCFYRSRFVPKYSGVCG